MCFSTYICVSLCVVVVVVVEGEKRKQNEGKVGRGRPFSTNKIRTVLALVIVERYRLLDML